MTDEEVIRAAMSLLGKRTSDRKRESSRANAKRPRKRKANGSQVCKKSILEPK